MTETIQEYRKYLQPDVVAKLANMELVARLVVEGHGEAAQLPRQTDRREPEAPRRDSDVRHTSQLKAPEDHEQGVGHREVEETPEDVHGG